MLGKTVVVVPSAKMGSYRIFIFEPFHMSPVAKKKKNFSYNSHSIWLMQAFFWLKSFKAYFNNMLSKNDNIIYTPNPSWVNYWTIYHTRWSEKQAPNSLVKLMDYSPGHFVNATSHNFLMKYSLHLYRSICQMLWKTFRPCWCSVRLLGGFSHENFKFKLILLWTMRVLLLRTKFWHRLQAIYSQKSVSGLWILASSLNLHLTINTVKPLKLFPW